MKTKIRTILLLVAAIILYSIYSLNVFTHDASINKSSIEENLHEAEKEILNISARMGNLVLSNPDLLSVYNFHQKLEKKWREKGYYFLIFENDSLIYWSDNKVSFSNILPEVIEDHALVKLRNGWYESFNKRYRNINIVAFLLIKNDYAYQNKYLNNNFNPLFKLNNAVELKSSSSDSTISINSAKGAHLFSISLPRPEQINANETTENFQISILFVFILFVFYLTIYIGSVLIKSNFSLPVKSFYPPLVLVIVLIAIIFQIPSEIFDSKLFSSQLYASSYILNSLGAFFLLSIIFFISIAFYYNLFRKHNLFENKYSGWLAMFFYFGLILVSNYLIFGLILNSNISFDVNNLFSLTIYSLIGFIIISGLMFSIYLMAQATANSFLDNSRNFYISVISVSVIFIILYFLFDQLLLFKPYNLLINIWAVIFIISIYVLTQRKRPSFEFTLFLPVIILLSSWSGHAMFKFNKIKEQNSRVILAQRLERDRDFIAEYLFEDISNAIKQDKLLIGLTSNPFQNADVIEKRINQLYFTGYWSKYDISFYVFDSLSTLYYNPVNDNFSLQSFRALIDNQGIPTSHPDFYFINESSGRTRYLGFLPVKTPAGTTTGTIVADMEARRVQEQNGFPELLLSSNISSINDYPEYSYARYNNELLITQHGDVAYRLRHPMLKIDAGDYRFVESKKHNHLVYRSDPNSAILLTKKKNTWLDYITVFSYMFAFFSITTLVYGFFKLIPFEISLIGLTFKKRIQQSMILLVVASLLLIGAGTIIYIINNNQQQKRVEISERLTSSLVLIEKELKNHENINELTEELSVKLGQLGTLMAADFHIYDHTGTLLFSTQPKLFDQGLISGKIDPEAYAELVLENNSRVIQNEKIGELKFLSAYAPLRNENNKTIGFINLPYFAKESELRNEISAFLVALINVYLLLMVLAVIIAVLVANRLTTPLNLIREKLRQTKLGSRNEYIEWKRNDEIGQLVAEYNRMVDQLTESADLMAKSERELAWREMAKQVAHEIKNPLTPMKLSVQHLERIWKDDIEDKEEKIKRLTQTLIQQIDTLSAIAGEFSNFAKLPKPVIEEIDIVQLLEGLTNFYGQQENIKTEFNSENSKVIILADKDQLLRIFNNILKNAVQAIPLEKSGLIRVEITQHIQEVIISISDNGEGIDTEEYSNIFQPNFTTKTGGTGLGLSMVKNIIQSMGGEIWFESKLNTGTTFFVKFKSER